MAEMATRATGLVVAVLYTALIVWLYVRQPQTIAQVTGGLTAAVGAYHIDRQAFDDGLAAFRTERFVEARSAFARADPAQRDARTQFYIAYACYREGWGRLYHDDVLYQQGVEAVTRAIALAPAGRLAIDDPDLRMHTAGELEAELEAGMHVDASDFNPIRVFRERK